MIEKDKLYSGLIIYSETKQHICKIHCVNRMDDLNDCEILVNNPFVGGDIYEDYRSEVLTSLESYSIYNNIDDVMSNEIRLKILTFENYILNKEVGQLQFNIKETQNVLLQYINSIHSNIQNALNNLPNSNYYTPNTNYNPFTHANIHKQYNFLENLYSISNKPTLKSKLTTLIDNDTRI